MKKKPFVPVLLMSLLLISCGGGGGADAPVTPVADYTAFSNPQPVSIKGYAGDVMEPFISRDGKYLFFNDTTVIPGTPPQNNKDIHYASYDSLSGTFTYEAVISAVNTLAVEGVPTLDNNNRFYYISTFNYPPDNAKILDTIYVGDFDPLSPAIVNNLDVVLNLRDPEGILGHLNFDVEISPDGLTLYFVDGIFSGKPFPDVSNFVYAVDTGSGFVRQADSEVIFANINTSDLEYAACISQDGLEFFFTRLELATLDTFIYRAIRPDTSSAFGVPQKVSAISGFVEAPTLSSDEKELYYHRRIPGTNNFELYRVTRP